MRSRKSTATITLVLIGAALHGCGGEENAVRDVYRNQTDCKRDWGDDDRKCERVTSGTHSGYYYGPSYGHSGSSTGTTLAPRSGSNAVSSTTVSRGGFGSSASSHSSGG